MSILTETAHTRTVTRAAEQAANYSFRRMTVKTSAGPVSIVYVYGGTETYQITEDRRHDRCTCPHYRKRLAGTLRACKHILCKRAWDQEKLAAQVEADLERRAAEVEQSAAQAARARRLLADWGEVD